MDTHRWTRSQPARPRGSCRRDSRCYGRPDHVPSPRTKCQCHPPEWHCLPALDRLDGYVLAGLPIVTALPGRVHGNASWFRERIVDPVMAGAVSCSCKPGPWVSLIHVHDCARALVHLAERGDVSSRYFLANNEPIRMQEFAQAFALLANRPLRV